ncbi:hypothetical protein AFIC_001573 [[Pseudomonas] carboxydohydrogena]|uniref:DUF2946 domain-containing protein n=1 Tax=Afipia carboxydohydrogena TaxID=290 RepID=A0ABY8BTW4_AFICR|nr:hypothetical protein [[Pseudomonas] carboxydohydrogena]WEF53051.1 hypothetical protein AFIC_001573 [[Pseudomonas] carboxydohydrogena]
MTTLRKIRLGRWAVIIAAYALLLNTTLTTSLYASLSPSSLDPAHYLCLNITPAADGPADHDTSHKRLISCPLCLSFNAFSFIAPGEPVLPTVQQAAKIVRVAPTETQCVGSTPLRAWARGPPSFV